MKRVALKMKDVRLFETPDQLTGKNRISPGNEFIEFKKEDIRQSISARFEQQVHNYPDKTAVKVDDQHLTYGELDNRANCVAHAVLREYDDSGRLNNEEKTRYQRQMMLHGWGIAAQEKLKNTTVFVGGAGGSGSPLIMQLGLAGFGTIIICDFDEVELSNLNRQVLHDKSRIGMNKALSAAQTLQRINPHVRIIAYSQKITRDNIQHLAAGSSIIFDNVDDIEAKFILSQYAVQQGIPHILSSMIDMNAYAAIFHTPHTPCYHCLYDRDLLKQLAEMKHLMKDYQKNPNPVASPALFMSTGFVVNEAIKIVLGFDKEKSAYNKFFLFNQRGVEHIVDSDGYQQLIYPFSPYFRELSRQQGFDWEKGWQGRFLEEIEVRPDPHCPACGKYKREELQPLPAPGSGTPVEPIADFTPAPAQDSNTAPLPTAALLFGHDADMVIGIMGALKAGKAYVPLDPGYPRQRLMYMLEDAEARVIITNNANYPLAIRLKEQVNQNSAIVNIDELETEKAECKENPGITIEPEDLAYILYTSGSTGQPKGVMQNHRNVLHFARVYANALHLNSSDRLTLLSSYGFDAAKMDIYGALLNGGTLFPYDIKKQDGLFRLVHWLEAEGITVYHSIPTVYRYFTDSLTGAERFAHLRFIVLGGEAVFKKDVETYKQYFPPDCLFVNGLGPTESTVTLQYFIDKNTEISKEAVPVGYPVAETEVLLLDEDDRETEGYGIGEIVYKSDYLALGYLHHREKTEAAFVQNPLTGRDRVYRSGDLGRRLHDGSIEYVGRKDDQVKVRGYRVELQEIEGKLDTMPGIKKSAVICKQDDMGEGYLIAYYVQSEGKPIDEMCLADGLKEFLPDYMVPGAFYRLPEFSLTATGKIDRSALARLAESQSRSLEEYVEPGPGIQQTLAGIWKQVLKVEKIGAHDNFFVLGGNSLKAILLTSLLHKELDARVSLVEVFRNPTICLLAGLIENTARETFTSIKNVEEKEYYRVSSAQKRLFVLQKIEPASTAYNMFTVLQLKGGLDREKMEVCFRRLIQRHESLRTFFFMISEEPVQRIQKEVKFEIEYMEPAARNPQPVKALISSFIRPFDLYRAPLIRVGLIESSHTPAALRTIPSQEGNRHGYILVVDIHHIIGDAVSNDLLAGEFMQLVTGNHLPPLRIQYKDYARWQAAEKEKGTIKKQEQWWIKEFSGEIPQLQLPLDYPRPMLQEFAGNHLTFGIEAEALNILKQMVREQETAATLYMVILSIFSILLAKLSGQEEVIIGTPIVGRTHSDLEPVIGVFVNTLAIPTYPRGHNTFKEFLTGIKEKTVTAFQNQDYQFEDLVEHVAVNRDASRNPLFDVMFSFLDLQDAVEQTPAQAQENEVYSLEQESFTYENTTAKFDLSLNGIETAEQLAFNFEYCTKLFKKETIQRLITYFKKIVSVVTGNINRKISEIEIISGEEKKQLLFDFNNTKKSLVRDKDYPILFEEQVIKNPDKTAAVSNHQHITYSQLSQEVNRIADFLTTHGVTVGSMVAVFLKRSINLLAAIIGIFKAGGVYLPIEVDYPPNRIAYMMEDSEAKIMITQAEYMLPSWEYEILCLDALKGIRGNIEEFKEPVSINPVTTLPDDLVYMIYTSGTTGKPKGVLIHQLGMLNHLYAKINDLSVTAQDIIAQTASACFDISVWQFLAALLTGGRIVIIDKEVVLEPRRFIQVLQQGCVTILESVPSLIFAFLETAAHEQENVKALPSLKWMIPTGESLGPRLVKEWYRHYPEIPLMNAYGPTEASDDVTHYIVNDFPHGNENPVTIPIGRPLQNCHIYILDEYLSLCPMGVRGEICVAGIGVGKGYWQDDRKTNQSFIPNPFLHEIHDTDYKLLYKTGDIGYFNADGTIVCLGRKDHQVKIRGNRIELGEIERHLLTHEKINDAVVVARTGENRETYLCAYIIPQSSPSSPSSPSSASSPSSPRLEISEIREYLLKYLPDYMVPLYFVSMDRFPLTANGKIRRSALPEPGIKDGVVSNYIPPRNQVEQILVKIWTGLLARGDAPDASIGSIGIDDNFFERGGHSLKATLMTAKIHQQLDVRLPLAEIFRTPTIRGLSKTIAGLHTDKYTSLEPLEKKEFYGLSSGQKRLYVLQQMEETSIAYNMSTFVELEGELPGGKLERTFKKLLERHESLRTSFLVVDDQPVQRVHDEVEFAIQYDDMKEVESRGDALTTGNRSGTYLSSEFIRPFDLSRVPLLRVGLVKVSRNRYILMADMHHIISDGISMDIWVKEFISVFTGSQLPPLRLQYKDFSEWRSTPLVQRDIKRQGEFWIKEFAPAISTLKLPLDYPRPAIRSFAGDFVGFVIDKTDIQGLKALALKEEVTLFMVLLAIYYVLLFKLSGQEDIVVGTGIAGRKHDDLQYIIGMFVNTLALRNYPGRDKTFTAFLAEIKEKTLSAYENQDYQFEELVEKAAPNRSQNQNPLFDTAFAFENREVEQQKAREVQLPGLIIKPHKGEHKVSRFDMTFIVVQMEEVLQGAVEYSTTLFKKETINRFVSYFKEIIAAINQDQEIKLKDIALSSDVIPIKSTLLQEDKGDFGF